MTRKKLIHSIQESDTEKVKMSREPKQNGAAQPNTPEKLLAVCRNKLDTSIDPTIYQILGERSRRAEIIAPEVGSILLRKLGVKRIRQHHGHLARRNDLEVKVGELMFDQVFRPSGYLFDNELDPALYEVFLARKRVGVHVAKIKYQYQLDALQPARADIVRERHMERAEDNGLNPQVGLIVFDGILHPFMLKAEQDVKNAMEFEQLLEATMSRRSSRAHPNIH